MAGANRLGDHTEQRTVSVSVWFQLSAELPLRFSQLNMPSLMTAKKMSNSISEE